MNWILSFVSGANGLLSIYLILGQIAIFLEIFVRGLKLRFIYLFLMEIGLMIACKIRYPDWFWMDTLALFLALVLLNIYMHKSYNKDRPQESGSSSSDSGWDFFDGGGDSGGDGGGGGD